MPVFCAYCGKSFTRKEHLERHIPSHTNVKPHRCSGCQLSFTRRDLLQRHHSTYHEARDPHDPSPNGLSSVAGRTPIACQNCANAKTGCDKRVPCSRCADKNLTCAARFARRSSKAALRAAQATVMNNALISQVQVQAQAQAQAQQSAIPVSVGPQIAFIDVDGLKSDAQLQPQPISGSPVDILGDAGNNAKQHSPELPSPQVMDELMNINTFVTTDQAYHDFLAWAPEYPMEINLYVPPMPRQDLSMTCFPELGDISPGSDTMTGSSSMSASTSTRGSIHTRGTSIISTTEFDPHFKAPDTDGVVHTSPPDQIAEFPVVIAAESAWPLARCCPRAIMGHCPRTAIVHLECLEHKAKDQQQWAGLEKYVESTSVSASGWDVNETARVVLLTSSSRDRMLAIAQSFLHKALDIHRGSQTASFMKTAGYSSPLEFNLIALPPNNVLECFLRSYVRSLSSYFPLVTASCLDPNEMVMNSQPATLLLLLMIAQGAASIPAASARFLSAGLTETCRISLFDIIEKNVEFSSDPVALRSGLLFTLLGAWSGDKWLMDIAMGQRGMYMSMLRHAGLLEPQAAPFSLAFDTSSGAAINIELQWHTWAQAELKNRLVYNWVMVDQELALFHDTAPMLSLDDMNCHIPGPDMLWTATSADQWVARLQSIYGCAPTGGTFSAASIATSSLYDLFQDFLTDNMSSRTRSLTPLHLRLLLHPIHTILGPIQQLITCFPDNAMNAWPSGSLSRDATASQLEDVLGLLRRWYTLASPIMAANAGDATVQAALAMYHLLCLQACTNFSAIEKMARKEDMQGFWDLGLRHKKCIFDTGDALFHCGQILRVVRAMPMDRRPAWWAAAVYRATLVMWADAIVRRLDPSHTTTRRQRSTTPMKPGTPGSQASPRSKTAGTCSTSSSSTGPAPSPDMSQGGSTAVVIDKILPEDPLATYVQTGESVLFLTGLGGSHVRIDQPSDVLAYGSMVINEGLSTRLGDGIKRKLVQLDANWQFKQVTAVPGVMA